MKILLSILSNVKEVESLHKIYTLFYDEGYSIEEFENNNGEIQIDHLPAVLDIIRNKKEYIGKKCEFVVISNNRDLLFSWYRCYNYLVNDFVYFLERKESIGYSGLEHTELLNHLSSFYGISNETLQGKIYVNLNEDNYKNLSPFLMNNYHFSYFDSIDHYDFKNSLTTKHLNKCYIVNGIEYDLSYNPEAQLQRCTLSKEKQNLNIDKKFINLIFNDGFFYLYYFIVTIYTSVGIDKKIKDSLFIMLFQEMKVINDEKRKSIQDLCMSFIQGEEASFADKAYFLSLLVIINNDNELLQDIMDLLKKDEENIKYHYPLLTNTLFYVTKEGLLEYPEMYNDRVKVLKKIIEYYNSKIHNKILKKPKVNSIKLKDKPKKIAIIAGQLLSINHAPTRMVFNRAINLKKYSNLEVKIFVDDMYVYTPGEVVFPYVFTSAKASSLKKLHSEYLDGEKVSIYYSEPNSDRTNRSIDFIKEVNKFQPDIIYSIGNDYSITVGLLYDFYPIVSHRIGSIPITKWSDIYLGSEVDFRAFNMESQCKYINPVVQIDEFPTSEYRIKRSDYNLNEDDFLLVTVGNRLDVDLTQKFLNLIISFIKDKKKVKWLIVGPLNNNIIQKQLEPYYKSGKIVRIHYEKDLSALYHICDVYINPPRVGGGFSGLLAMKMGIPIVSPKGEWDITKHIGQENAIEGEKEYLEEINKLFLDKNYKKENGLRLKEKYRERFDNKRAVESYMQYYIEAIYLYKIRNKMY